MKKPGGGGTSFRRFSPHSFTPIFEGPRFASAVICALYIPNGFTGCATQRLYPPWPQSIAHTSCRHGGVPLRAVHSSSAQSALISSRCALCLCRKNFRLDFNAHKKYCSTAKRTYHPQLPSLEARSSPPPGHKP